ncbi:MAG: TIGR00366 family protein, partial [Tissierellia bacterium]|nr:TIGR00366 family protein [Tissierellia bacterium]
STPAEKMEHSRLLSLIIGAIGLVYIFFFFAKNGFNLNLNIVNTIFLILGIILHGTPLNYVKAVEEAAKGAAGIILQFPFYAGIMGMMTGANADGVSLASVISNFFVNIATVRTFPLFSFWSAGIVNFFVPSGGGQWSVQGPIMLPAARELGVNPGLAAMSIAWGDAWTNLLQPFWALPALGLAKLGARDIMGYCVITLLVSGIIISGGLLLLV